MRSISKKRIGGRPEKKTSNRATASSRQAKLVDLTPLIDPNYSFDGFSDEYREQFESRTDQDENALAVAEKYANTKKNEVKIGDILFIGSSHSTRQENGYAVVLPHSTKKTKLMVHPLEAQLAWGLTTVKEILIANKVKYDDLFVNSKASPHLAFGVRRQLTKDESYQLDFFHNEFLAKNTSGQDELYPIFLRENLLSKSTKFDYSKYWHMYFSQ